MGDLLRDRIDSGVIFLAAVWDDKPGFLAMVTPDLIPRGLSAGEIVKRAAQETGGGGGGKPQMAQGGGKDAGRVDQTLESVLKLVEGKV
jgi:alanyl-tRNA synthetase